MAEPVINNVTTTAQYVKDGDFIELYIICDQANYSVFANFSMIDDAFLPADEKILDYNNRTYRVNYTLNLLNNISDGTYQVLINVTNTTTSEFTIYTDLNLTLDNTLPSSAAITSPGEGAYLKGNHTLQAVAADAGTGVQYVEFWLDDAGNGTLLDIDYSAPYNYTWDTNSTPEGPHALFVRVYDLAGNANTSLAINITIDNTIPSAATMTSPGEGAYLKGNHTLQAVAADAGTGVQYVEFWLDDAGTGTRLDTDYSAPYNYTWDTNSTPEGPHALFVRVYDLAGNANTSLAINITIDNTIPNITIVSITQISGNYFIIVGNASGTFSPISYFHYNITNFTLSQDPTGKLSEFFFLDNGGQPLAEGFYVLTITLNDSVDFTNSLDIPLTVDTTPPTGSQSASTNLGSPQNGDPIGSIWVNGTASDGAGTGMLNVTVVWTNHTGNPWSTNLGTNESWAFNNVSAINDGIWGIMIEITDKSRNSRNISCFIFVDTVVPTGSQDLVTQAFQTTDQNGLVWINGTAGDINGSGILNVFIEGWNGTGNPWSANQNTTDAWSFSNASAILDGRWEVYVNITDCASNSFNLTCYVKIDTRPPLVETIQRNPMSPNQYMEVNISIAFLNDSGSEIVSILLKYSIDDGATWNWKNITQNNWGLIESQPPFTTVRYQIIVIDGAGNKYASGIMSYSVKFDYTRLLIILIIIGAVAGASTYTGKKFYSKRKQRSLQLQFMTEKKEFTTYIDYRLSEIDIILNDINTIESKLDTLLKYQWVYPKVKLKQEDSNRYQLIREYVGTSQLSTEITDLKIDLDIKLKEMDKKFHSIKPHLQLSHKITRFDQKLDAAVYSLNRLNKELRIKYSYLYEDEIESPRKVEFPFKAFDQVLAKCLNTFQVKYEALAKKLDQLLISRKIKLIEKRIDELELVFKETDEWLQKAEKWSKKLPLPKDRGYKYLLKLKNKQYSSVKNEFGMKIEKFRAELMSSITFAQNFINWNLENLQKRLMKFETVIFEDALRYISSEDANIASIDLFMEEKFNYFNSLLTDDKTKVDEFYGTHKEFYIQELYKEWVALVEDIPAKLEELRHGLNTFIQPLHRLFKLIKGTTINFYEESMAEIEKHAESEHIPTEVSDELTPLSILFSHTVWKINRIDNEINDWINLLPFDLETPQLIILLREWNETKEEVLGKLNTLSREQKIYKCEIMHEILDPLNEEVWECSNCGAIACNEHLERWYHRKKAPECFKCGKTNTFKLKIITL
ncbi:MAG: hypothetical protein HWN65_21840 [Candidatus Helarchaeota archaeon]|nr:hypothetical protein [Candidatus Helarchaeota archaeon]